MLADLLRGLGTSLEIFAFTLLIALPLGFPLALGRMSRNRLLSGLIGVWISIVRGTPLMLQIIFVYFAPYILFGMPLSRYPRLLATVLAFGLNYGAYFAEIYRGGILSIDPGQHEAAKALGLSRAQTFFRIVLPQTVKRVIPAVGNEVITLVKDTCLARIIAIYELTYAGQAFIKSDGLIWPLLMTGIFYLAVSGLLSMLLKREEKRLAYFE